MENNNFFKDPIHGEIFLDNDLLFLDLISSKEFTRLKKIKQLGICEKIFHTATHNRYSHSIGVYNLSKLFIQNLGINLNSKNAKITMVSALLHDVGHGPFSHVFEKISNIKHELVSIQIIKSKETEINQILKKHKMDIDAICNIYELKAEYPWMWQIISSTVDVDRMDYILRDSYMIGTKYGTIDVPFLISRTKLNNDNFIIYSHKSKNIIHAFLQARIFMKEDVYENNNVILYEWTLINIFSELKKHIEKIQKIQGKILHWEKFKFLIENSTTNLNVIENIDNYLQLCDNSLIDFVKSFQYKKISNDLEILMNSFFTGEGLEWEEVKNYSSEKNYGVQFKEFYYDLLGNKKIDEKFQKFETDILLYQGKEKPYDYVWFSNIIPKKNDTIKIIKLKNTNFN